MLYYVQKEQYLIKKMLKYKLDKIITLATSAEMNFTPGKCPIDHKSWYFTPMGYQIEYNL